MNKTEFLEMMKEWFNDRYQGLRFDVANWGDYAEFDISVVSDINISLATNIHFDKAEIEILGTKEYIKISDPDFFQKLETISNEEFKLHKRTT